MKVAFITRSTLYTAPGGDAVQTVQTVRQLRALGVEADICLTNTAINYAQYDLFHFLNITRPADILFHIEQIKKPFVLSPILIDYSEYDQHYRKGMTGLVLRLFSAYTNEFIKTCSRWIMGKDSLASKSYLWKGQLKSMREIIAKAAMILPNSESEYKKIRKLYGNDKSYSVVPNGIDLLIFKPGTEIIKNNTVVLCAARIEGIKNQLNLIKALNNTNYTLLLIGSAAPNQKKYYRECRRIAAKNIVFLERMPQEQLADHYKKAKVHALPSWFETCGLSSLEAAAMGSNIVITDKGYTRDYFGDDAFYCDPADPKSIFSAIEKAAYSDSNDHLSQKIRNDYTWQRAAAITLAAYKKVLTP